ncbi:MAG TPA: RT0821/Lpp0805 family surface protein [Caldimonas sp.]|nr:RT0821/Lpp0805 family surface protein [Caldimonas sp.]
MLTARQGASKARETLSEARVIERVHTMSIRCSILVVCLAAAAAPALAQSQLYGTTKGTPSELFDDEDRRLLREAIDKGLRDAAVDEAVRWENPKTESRGEVKVLSAFEWKKAPCRKIRVSNQARTRKATNDFNFCRVGEKWKLVSPSELSKAN